MERNCSIFLHWLDLGFLPSAFATSPGRLDDIGQPFRHVMHLQKQGVDDQGTQASTARQGFMLPLTQQCMTHPALAWAQASCLCLSAPIA